ncbi:HD domain-containing protein [Geothrix edaphica]|uniref:HD/PDEase domain-containing protein n=1 Tax=Geothrix edaphica TaxID=2927976 RepID=A0ABQ5PUE9_9BACT|nr:HD domain-containing protein [Geothrix edaphica]GLH65988.1 hypothetical protein GETHED_03520 [Geothrix edaphica]
MTQPLDLTPRFTQALEFARTAHQGQLRKGTTIPYLAHPLAVASLALTFGADEDEAIAALLHDTAEDGGGAPMLARIEAAFGSRVAAIVRACSDSLTEDPQEKAPWRERKETHFAHLATAPHSVRLVAAADKLHNLQSLLADLRTQGNDVWSRFKAGRPDQLWYYGAGVDRLAADPAAPWSRPLRDAYRALSELHP